MKATSIIMAALVTVTVLFSGCRDKDVEYTYVQKIKLKRFPMTTTDGSTWDLNNGPDVYLKITENGTERWVAPTVVDDAISGTNYPEWTLSPSLNMSDPNGKLVIECFDRDDLDGDDFMANLEIKPYDGEKEGVVTKTFSNSQLDVDVTFEFQY